MESIPLEWTIQYLQTPSDPPQPTQPIHARVPGAVQRD